MDISIVILTFNEERNIGQCLESVMAQEFDIGKVEVLVVDGVSIDNTVRIVRSFMKYYKHLSIVTNERRWIAAGRNVGIYNSKYPYISFLDADCVVKNNWLISLAKWYCSVKDTDERVAGVGGGNIPLPDAGGFEQSLGIVLNSFLGSLNSAQGRDYKTPRRVESLACLNVLYSKEALLRVGGFDASMGNISEDLDINIRLAAAGYTVYFAPNVQVYHKLRPNLSTWAKNVALYARGRMRVWFKHRRITNPFFILPLFFIPAMAITILGIVDKIFLLPLVYFPITVVYGISLTIKERVPKRMATVIALFWLTHFIYAANFTVEMLRLLRGGRKAY